MGLTACLSLLDFAMLNFAKRGNKFERSLKEGIRDRMPFCIAPRPSALVKPGSIHQVQFTRFNSTMQLITLTDAAATQSLGAALGQVISAGTVVLLNGDLGSGKTTFVQGLGTSLGIQEPIVSPTFTLVNEYPEARIPLYHFDLYRLQPDEAAALYLEGYWQGDYPAGVVAIEWPERLQDLSPDYLEINLSIAEAESGVEPGRLAQLTAIGSQPQQILQALLARIAG